MERLTEHHVNETLGAYMACSMACIDDDFDCNNCEKLEEIVDRLAAYEDAMPIERAQELAQAEKDARLVVLPCRTGDELASNGLTFKADHWNVILTAFADDASALLGKRIKLFYPEEAEAALKKREET